MMNEVIYHLNEPGPDVCSCNDVWCVSLCQWVGEEGEEEEEEGAGAWMFDSPRAACRDTRLSCLHGRRVGCVVLIF